MELLNVSANIPDLTLLNAEGLALKLTDLCKDLTLLFFYPKALTSGCTTEACGIRDGMTELKNKGLTVYGISPDSPTKLTQFIAKEELNFTLLSDESHKVCEAFGAFGPKKMYGREYFGVYRVSFIAKNNKIIAQFPKVKPKEHLSMILAWLEANPQL